MQAWANPTWSKVTVPGRTGEYYIISEFLSPTQPAPAWQVRYGTATLRYAPNVVNNYVKNLQRDLYRAGYTFVTQADGRYGPITKQLLKTFRGTTALQLMVLLAIKPNRHFKKSYIPNASTKARAARVGSPCLMESYIQ